MSPLNRNGLQEKEKRVDLVHNFLSLDEKISNLRLRLSRIKEMQYKDVRMFFLVCGAEK